MSLPASDGFNRGPAVLGSSWTDVNGTWVIAISNNVTQSDAAEAFTFWNADAFPADQYSKAKMTNLSGFPGVAGRIAAGPNAYGVYANDTGIYKWVGGGRSSLGSWSGAFSVGDVLEVRITGLVTVTVAVYVNGVLQGSAPDTVSPLTSGAAGLLGFSSLGIDDWEGGSLAAAPPTGSVPLGWVGHYPTIPTIGYRRVI